MFDFPIRRGRNLINKYSGLSNIIYSIYGMFFFGLTIITGGLLAMYVDAYLREFAWSFSIIFGIVAFGLFSVLTISIVERRSRNEMFLMKLQEKYPSLYEVDYKRY